MGALRAPSDSFLCDLCGFWQVGALPQGAR
jgi:hypothetical protein